MDLWYCYWNHKGLKGLFRAYETLKSKSAIPNNVRIRFGCPCGNRSSACAEHAGVSRYQESQTTVNRKHGAPEIKPWINYRYERFTTIRASDDATLIRRRTSIKTQLRLVATLSHTQNGQGREARVQIMPQRIRCYTRTWWCLRVTSFNHRNPAINTARAKENLFAHIRFVFMLLKTHTSEDAATSARYKKHHTMKISSVFILEFPDYRWKLKTFNVASCPDASPETRMDL